MRSGTRLTQTNKKKLKKIDRRPVVLLHSFGMSNFSVNFLYSVGRRVETERKTEEENKVGKR